MKKIYRKILLNVAPIIACLFCLLIDFGTMNFIVGVVIQSFIVPIYLTIVNCFHTKLHWKNISLTCFLMLIIVIIGIAIQFLDYYISAFPPGTLERIPAELRSQFKVDDITIALFQAEAIFSCIHTILFWAIANIIRKTARRRFS